MFVEHISTESCEADRAKDTKDAQVTIIVIIYITITITITIIIIIIIIFISSVYSFSVFFLLLLFV